MNFNDFIFYDFETGSKSARKCQPLQLAAVVIDARKLTIRPNSVFNTLIKPLSDSQAEACGIDPVSDEALEVNHIKREDLKSAPSCKLAWSQFVEYVNKYNRRKNRWAAPIKAGYNNCNYDDIILDRLCCGQYCGNITMTRDSFKTVKKGPHDEVHVKDYVLKEPYGFGPSDDVYGGEALFHPFNNIDVMKEVFSWIYENDKKVTSISMDTMREYLGMPADKAHDAEYDVLQGAEMLVRFLKLKRNIMKSSIGVKFKGTCSESKLGVY